MLITQIYVPLKMILSQERIVKMGTEFKFETAPVDPNDPFRGKYITLQFEENTVNVKDGSMWTPGENINVIIEKNQNDVAMVKSILRESPIDNQHFVKAKISHINQNTVYIQYPFETYYMEESKAYDAEVQYRNAAIDSNVIAYAIVNIINGDAALKDVTIDGTSIVDLVEKN